MRRWQIAGTFVLALSLISGPALAKEIPMTQKQSTQQLKASCKKNGGKFTEGENSSTCSKNGNTVECSKQDQHCVGLTSGKVAHRIDVTSVLGASPAKAEAAHDSQ